MGSVLGGTSVKATGLDTIHANRNNIRTGDVSGDLSGDMVKLALESSGNAGFGG